MKAPSTAILCIARDEQPFAREWIQYHLNLGFDHIYFISTDDDFSSVHALYSGFNFGSKVSLHHFNDFNRGWQINCYRHFSSQVEEDWLLILDLDEFLYLNPNTDIKSYLATFGEEKSITMDSGS